MSTGHLYFICCKLISSRLRVRVPIPSWRMADFGNVFTGLVYGKLFRNGRHMAFWWVSASFASFASLLLAIAGVWVYFTSLENQVQRMIIPLCCPLVSVFLLARLCKRIDLACCKFHSGLWAMPVADGYPSTRTIHHLLVSVPEKTA